MRIGLHVSTRDGAPLDELLERFVAVESRGFDTAWVGQVFDHDALTLLALAGRATRRVELGSWVVPTPPRHPVVLAQQALTVQAASQNRLALGIGVSHEAVVTRRLGLDPGRPLPHMREYLTVLRPLLRGERVEHRGERYRVSLALDPTGAAPPPVLLAALGPGLLDLAGREADGAAIWLGGPRFLEQLAIPRVRAAARDAGRPPPRIACGFAIAVVDDLARGRESADRFLARSSRLPAYRRVLDREGAKRPSDVAIIGDETHVRRRLEELAAIGVTDLNAVCFPVEREPAAQRSVELLSELALGARG